MPNLFIISGCNGAGKTTASFTILPELLHVTEFVNADEIAKGLSPFQPHKVSIEAGRIMLRRIKELIIQQVDFAFETTLASRSFVSLCMSAKQGGYQIYILFLWLDSIDLAIERVRQRVVEGGHSIPTDIITRRYKSGLINFFTLYKELVDYWIFIDNSTTNPELIAEGKKHQPATIYNRIKWQQINAHHQHENL